MLRDLPLNKLHVDRDFVPDDDLKKLTESMATYGQQFPLLVTTDMLVHDGWKRLVVARNLRWKTIQCEITNDYPRMIENIRKAHEGQEQPPPLRIMELYRSLQPYGDPWAYRARTEYRNGLGIGRKPGQSYPGEKDQRFGHRLQFSPALGLSDSWINEYLEFFRTVDRALAIPGLESYAKEVFDLVTGSNGTILGPGGGRQFLFNLMQAPSRNVATIVARWRDRQAAKLAQVNYQPIKRVSRQQMTANATRLPPELKGIGDVISTLEGTILALKELEVPDMDPEMHVLLSRRVAKIRREVSKFAKTIIQKGIEQ